ncbi:unnamed protein product, partial [marine sediment metagenome]
KLTLPDLDKMVLEAIEGGEGEGKKSPIKRLLDLATKKKAGEGETK